MKKYIGIILFSLAFLVACSPKDEVRDEDLEEPASEVADVSEEEEVVEEIEEVEDPFKDIYDQLDGKTFYKNVPSAAYAIHFYEDGYFDAGYRTGNGDYRGIYLANGKYDIVEKIDDDTYKVELVKYEYETEDGKREYKNSGGLVLEVVSIGGDASDKLDTGDIYLYLPTKKIETIDEETLRAIIGYEYPMNFDPNGYLVNTYLIGGKKSGFLWEVIENEN